MSTINNIQAGEVSPSSGESSLVCLLKQFTLQEKIDMVSGVSPFYKGSFRMMGKEFGYASAPWVAAQNCRLGVAGVKFVDGPRGIVLKGGVTFPVSSHFGVSSTSD